MFSWNRVGNWCNYSGSFIVNNDLFVYVLATGVGCEITCVGIEHCSIY